jgi:hypothetical protein
MLQTPEPKSCPTPHTHDKLGEAHYFVHQMVDHYHEPDAFRYSLSAFLQAARNITFVLQSEMSGKVGFDEFWKLRQEEMRANADLKLLNDARVTVVHKSSLIPASSMFIGHFKYGRPKSGLANVPLDPMMESIEALTLGRRASQMFEHPHRMWSGEEFGLQRMWALTASPGRELVQFALGTLETVARVFSQTHEWAGFGHIDRGNCEHFNSEGYRNLRESEVFKEVEKAWDGPPTEQLAAVEGSLALLAVPADSSEVLHKVSGGTAAKGWINTEPSKYWSPDFASMLLYSIGDEVITKDTGVFFKRSAASISTLDEEDSEDG